MVQGLQDSVRVELVEFAVYQHLPSLYSLTTKTSSMKTLEQLQSEAREKMMYVDISRDGRNHTCEAWNGLGDDLYGKAMPDEVFFNKLDTLITTAYNAGLERAVEVVESKRKDTSVKECGGDIGRGMVACPGCATCGQQEDCVCEEYNQAIDDISTQLQAEVNKDNPQHHDK